MGCRGRGGGSPLADDAKEDEGEGRAMTSAKRQARTKEDIIQFFEVRCFAISNLHPQGANVKFVSIGFFPEAIDYKLSCGHSVRFNLKPEFWETRKH